MQNSSAGQWKCGGDTLTGDKCQRSVSAPGRRCFDHALPTVGKGSIAPSEYVVYDGLEDGFSWCKYPGTLVTAVRHARMMAISSTHQVVKVLHKKTREVVLTIYGHSEDVERGPRYEESLRELTGIRDR